MMGYQDDVKQLKYLLCCSA